MNQDLNDLYYFVQIVDHGGFTQAGKALGEPKSKLSRRIALLEKRLNVRLIQRSPRSFSVTEIGQRYYTHCKAMLIEAEAAQQAIESTQSEPCGTLRISCPIALLHTHVSTMIVEFARQQPDVTIELIGLNRPVDIIAEGVDVAIRVRPLPLEDSDLVMRVLGYAEQCLVASSSLIKQYGKPFQPIDLASWPSLGYGPSMNGHVWHLMGPEDVQADLNHTPRFITTDMLTLRGAAAAGIGAVQLPSIIVRDQLSAGQLVCLLPEWRPQREIIHAVFPSRRGLLPSVRAILDFLAKQFESIDDEVGCQ